MVIEKQCLIKPFKELENEYAQSRNFSEEIWLASDAEGLYGYYDDGRDEEATEALYKFLYRKYGNGTVAFGLDKTAYIIKGE